MKGVIKTVIAGAVIIGIGVALLVIALSQNGWSIDPNVEFTTETYTAENENTALDIHIDAGTLRTEYYDGDAIYVEYPAAENLTTKVYEKDGTFHFENDFRWNFFMFGFGTLKIPDTVIKLPKGIEYDIDLGIAAGTVNLADGKFGKVELDMSAGTIKCEDMDCSSLKLHISAGTVSLGAVDCGSLDMHMSAGTAKIESLNCGNTKLKVSAGTAKLGYTGSREEYRISTSVSAGSCNVSSQSGTTDKAIDINLSAGTVKVEFAV